MSPVPSRTDHRPGQNTDRAGQHFRSKSALGESLSRSTSHLLSQSLPHSTPPSPSRKGATTRTVRPARNTPSPYGQGTGATSRTVRPIARPKNDDIEFKGNSPQRRARTGDTSTDRFDRPVKGRPISGRTVGGQLKSAKSTSNLSRATKPYPDNRKRLKMTKMRKTEVSRRMSRLTITY